MEEEKTYIQFTGKQMGVLIVSFVAALSGGASIYSNNNADDDSTSIEYNDLDDRLRLVEHDVTECRSKQDNRDRSIKEGKRRFSMLWDLVHTHQATVIEKHKAQDEKISECMGERK